MTLESRKTKLVILGTYMGLILSQEDALEEIETRIRLAAKNQPHPYGFSSELAIELGVEFEGEIDSCFGFWDNDSVWCRQCPQVEDCKNFVNNCSMGSLVKPAIKSFEANTHANSELFNLNPPTDSTLNSSQLVRDRLLKRLNESSSFLIRKENQDSTCFLFCGKTAIKVYPFSDNCFGVDFCCTESLANALEWNLSGNVLDFRGTDESELIGLTDQFLSKIYLLATKKFSELDAFKSEIVSSLINLGLKIDYRSGYEIIVDPKNNARLMYLENFSNRGMSVCFTMMNDENGESLNLKKTKWGYYYKGKDSSECRKALEFYIDHYIKHEA